jgi:aspartate ammonia-lyase
MGCDMTVAVASEAGQLELNVMMPVIAWNVLHASTILREAMRALRTRTIDGITANELRARELLDRSTATATALSPYLGYAVTADIAKESVRTEKTIRAIVEERGLLSAEQLDGILSAESMTKGGIVGEGGAHVVGEGGTSGEAPREKKAGRS